MSEANIPIVIQKGSPLDIIQKKVTMYVELYNKLLHNQNINLEDLLELRNLGVGVNKGIKILCIDDALKKGHQFDNDTYTCKICGKYVYDATLVNCTNNASSSAAPNAEQSVSYPVNGPPPPQLPLVRTGISDYLNISQLHKPELQHGIASVYFPHASAFNAQESNSTKEGGRRTKRNKRKNKRRTTRR
jgi:hypothetical protein